MLGTDNASRNVKMSEESIGSDILAVLGIAVLEQKAGGDFSLVGSAPFWFLQLCPGADAGPEALTRFVALPFLENFLVDAEAFWTSKSGGRLKSGVWTETGPRGDEFYLEASAVFPGGRKILLIENQILAHEEKKFVLQKARTANLKRRERKRTEERGSR
jgi:hypothetical protein